jgi:hypothetical protein
MNKKYLLYSVAGVCLFLISLGGAYLIFSQTSGKPAVGATPTTNTANNSKRPTIDPSIPRTEVCPINGMKFTKQERAVWEKRRPLAVMIENSFDSRPTSGLSSADVVYEAIAEGGITRFMGIFYCGVAVGNTTFAPVRSARIYYTRVVPEYDALYNHVGGAGLCDDPTVDERAKALCFIRRNKIKDLDQFGLDFKSCHRLANRLDKEVAYEHTMGCFSDELYKTAEKREWTNVDENGVAWNKNFVSWKFKEDSKTPGIISNIKFEFWSNKPDYDVEWKYDTASNSYKRFNGTVAAMDLETEEQLTAKNVIIQFVKETGPVDEHKHLLYDVTGTGKVMVFQDGQVVNGTWSKSTPASRTKFMDASGKEIQLNAGVTWIEWVPAGNEIEYN